MPDCTSPLAYLMTDDQYYRIWHAMTAGEGRNAS